MGTVAMMAMMNGETNGRRGECTVVARFRGALLRLVLNATIITTSTSNVAQSFPFLNPRECHTPNG